MPIEKKKLKQKLKKDLKKKIKLVHQLLDIDSQESNAENALLVKTLKEKSQVPALNFNKKSRKKAKILRKKTTVDATVLYDQPEPESIEEIDKSDFLPREQGYIVVPSEKRLLLLYTFLKKNRTKKIIVSFNSCSAVKYHDELFDYIELPVKALHAKQKESKRNATFSKFSKAESGTLLCSEIAVRGLIFPKIDWMIQFDPPNDPEQYVEILNRVNLRNQSLLFIRPEEMEFLNYLKQFQVNSKVIQFPLTKICNIQMQLEDLMQKIYYLYLSATEAYKTYLRMYHSHPLSDIFDFNRLDLEKVAASFGLKQALALNLNVPRKGMQLTKRKGGGGFGVPKKEKSNVIYKQPKKKLKSSRTKTKNKLK